MYKTATDVYISAAGHLLEAVDDRNYYSGTVEWCDDDTEYALTVSAVVYREWADMPEGRQSVVCDMVPVWWEFHTTVSGEEVLNDFSFNELRRCIRHS